MINIKYLSCILHKQDIANDNFLYANIQYLMINIKNLLTNVKSCGIIDSTKGNNTPDKNKYQFLTEDLIMKNANIKKINDLGKAGKILSIILRVVTLICLICSVIFGIAMATLPEDFLKVNGKWSGTTIVDYSSPLVGRGEKYPTYDDELHFGAITISRHETETEDPNNSNIVTTVSEAEVNGQAGKSLKIVAVVIAVLIVLMLGFLAVSLTYSKKLCESLEKCDSPFEEKVVKAMKRFAFSLIPWGIVCVSAGGLSAIGILFIVIIVVLFSAVFNHGAELQRESDETL